MNKDAHLNSTPVESHRSSLAARVGCITREEFCLLANIEDSTEEAWRKRGKAPPYVVLGRSILYPTKGLAEHMQTMMRGGATSPANHVI